MITFIVFRFQSHVHKGNVFTDLEGFRKTTQGQPKEDGDYGVYVIDTESVRIIYRGWLVEAPQ